MSKLGLRLDEGWGKAAFWLTFLGFWVVFVPLYADHSSAAMPRHTSHTACPSCDMGRRHPVTVCSVRAFLGVTDAQKTPGAPQPNRAGGLACTLFVAGLGDIRAVLLGRAQ